MKIKNKQGIKLVKSDDYNYIFNKKDGMFIRWGKTSEEDPDYSKFGPEILDIEVTTICNHGCKFCYKNNNKNGKNMSLNTFKGIIDKMLPSKTQAGITQVAFGADATLKSNPDLFKMMDYCREKEIVPNITVAKLSDNIADELIKRVGAVAISRYDNKDDCYDSVKKLTDRGLKQTNIHMMISEETYVNAIETMKDYKVDKRLKDLNAIVFLSLKKKGRGVGHTPLSQTKFNELIRFAFGHNIPIGFDSCSAHKFLESIKGRADYNKLAENVEPCESSCFSLFCDVEGKFHPCSFCENHKIYGKGTVIKTNFLKDVWNGKIFKKFRENNIKNNRKCLIYKI